MSHIFNSIHLFYNKILVRAWVGFYSTVLATFKNKINNNRRIWFILFRLFKESQY